MRNPAGILIDLWEFERDGERAAVTVGGWLSSNDREVVLDAALAGEGVGRFNQLTTRGHLQSGRLVAALPDWQVIGGPPVNVLFRPNQRRTPRVRLFVEFVTTLVQAAAAGDPAVGSTALAERPHWHRRGYGRASTVLRWGS
jgi:DNA-binding transcriptional LysR family regulator